MGVLIQPNNPQDRLAMGLVGMAGELTSGGTPLRVRPLAFAFDQVVFDPLASKHEVDEFDDTGLDLLGT